MYLSKFNVLGHQYLCFHHAKPLRARGRCLDWHFPPDSSQCIYPEMWTLAAFTDSKELISTRGSQCLKGRNCIPPSMSLALASFQIEFITAPVAITTGIAPLWPARDCHLAGRLPASQQPPHRPSLSSTKSVP